MVEELIRATAARYGRPAWNDGVTRDGNAMSVLSITRNDLLAQGWPRESVNTVIREAKTFDYDGLVSLCLSVYAPPASDDDWDDWGDDWDDDDWDDDEEDSHDD
jgi:hypothetical protein